MSQPENLNPNNVSRRTRGELRPSSRFAVSFNVLLAIVLLSVGATVAFGIPTIFKTGVTIKKTGVSPGYVIANLPDGKSYAIDIRGNFAKTWVSPVAGTTLNYTRPLPTGNLLAQVTPATGVVHQIVEFTQAGSQVWQYTDTADRTFHHDMFRLSNGNTLIVCSRPITNLAISPKPLTDDCLLVVDPNGNIVFTWQTADHFNDFGFSDAAKASISANGGDWAHMNSAEEIPQNTWGDSRFKPGNYIVSYRHINIFMIVDPSTGSIVWQSTNNTIGQHWPLMIRQGFSGAGNILIFDNGFSNVENNIGTTVARFYTRVLEMNPLDFSTVHEYNEALSGLPLWYLFNPFVGSAQRLPNGNTLICEGADGRVFEINAAGTILWEWMDPEMVVGFQGPSSLVYRAEKVGLTWLQP